MTVLVGILCSDGVVIGTDSAAASSPIPGHVTLEQQDQPALKIEIIGADVITAVTGSVGLAQRFNDQVTNIFGALKQAFQPPQVVPGIGLIGTPLQQVLATQVKTNQVPINVVSTVEIGRLASQIVINDFKRT